MFTALHPGARVGGYEIVGHVGTHGPAAVYVARTPAGELRILKVMALQGVPAKARARFAQEGEVLALIVHPNVCRIYDAGGGDDEAWLLLERIEGETLEEKRRAGPLPVVDVLHWMMQVCAGLAEAHAVGVIHRDLTPDHIWVTPCGTAKVGDFGLAKLSEWGVETTMEHRIGTTRYGSPRRRGEPAAESMDIYSVGQIMYELLTGQHPMGPEPRSLGQTVEWQLLEHPRPLRELAPWVSSSLAELVHQAFEKDPARRPASMDELIGRLREEQTHLRAPQRRAARNVPGMPRDVPMAPTGPMAVVQAPASAPAPVAAAAPLARGGTLLMMAAPSAPPAPSSTLAAPSAPASSPPITLPAGRWPAQSAPELTAPGEVRSTDVPVESAARPSRVTPRRRPTAAIVAGVVTLTAAAAGWMLLGPVPGSGPEAASAPRPAAPALPSASASAPVPMGEAPRSPAPRAGSPAASGSATATTPPHPGRAGTPAKTSPRPAAPATRPPGKAPARNRIFGSDE